MGNQASEDELTRILTKLENAVEHSVMRRVANRQPVSNKSVHRGAVLALQSLIRTEKLKLLAAVRERVVGEDKKPTGSMTGLITIDTARNELRAEMRNELTKLEAEL